MRRGSFPLVAGPGRQGKVGAGVEPGVAFTGAWKCVGDGVRPDAHTQPHSHILTCTDRGGLCAWPNQGPGSMCNPMGQVTEVLMRLKFMKIFSKADDDKGLSLFTFSHCGSVLALLGPCGWTLPGRLLCPWDSPGQNTGVGCHALLQGIFPTQGSTRVSCASCIGKRVLYLKATWGACWDQAVQSVIGLGQ